MYSNLRTFFIYKSSHLIFLRQTPYRSSNVIKKLVEVVYLCKYFYDSPQKESPSQTGSRFRTGVPCDL